MKDTRLKLKVIKIRTLVCSVCLTRGYGIVDTHIILKIERMFQKRLQLLFINITKKAYTNPSERTKQ